MTLSTILIYFAGSFLIGLLASVILGYNWRKSIFFLALCGLAGILIARYLVIETLGWGLGSWSSVTVSGITFPWFWGTIAALLMILLFHNTGGKRRYSRRR